MKKTVNEKAYAKINLHLDVTGRAENGYHLVHNVMQTLSLHDDLTIEETEGEEILLSCNLPEVPCDGRNLAHRAAMLYRERTGYVTGLRIHIEKRIPMAAGMAGGSADGAALLRGLNRMAKTPLSVEELCALGAKLGADVPFCIVGGTAFADGLGEKLHAFPRMPHGYLVCACEGEGVSTPWAYGLLDEEYEGFRNRAPQPMERLRHACERGDLSGVGDALYNIFEEPVLARRPVAKQVLTLLRACDPKGAMMSGSGPSVFALFDRKEEAERGAALLRSHGFRAYLCTPVDRIEESFAHRPQSVCR